MCLPNETQNGVSCFVCIIFVWKRATVRDYNTLSFGVYDVYNLVQHFSPKELLHLFTLEKSHDFL